MVHAAKIGKFGDSAKQIPNFFTIRHEKALQIGVQSCEVVAFIRDSDKKILCGCFCLYAVYAKVQS